MFKPVIKWSGSKRSQSAKIKEYLPDKFNRYYEPFIGGGSMLYAINPSDAVCGDICVPLIDLWNEIKNNPVELSEAYKQRWTRLQTEGYQAYYEIRDDFNKNRSPEDLLFLTRTCVNGLIRFNANGDFNNSLHHTRPGISPDSLEKIILDWSKHVQEAEFIAADYTITTETAQEGDLIYLDPPYFHTKGRYYGTIDFEVFLAYLEQLNSKGIQYMLSFDGTCISVNGIIYTPVTRAIASRHTAVGGVNDDIAFQRSNITLPKIDAILDLFKIGNIGYAFIGIDSLQICVLYCEKIIVDSFGMAHVHKGTKQPFLLRFALRNLHISILLLLVQQIFY